MYYHVKMFCLRALTFFKNRIKYIPPIRRPFTTDWRKHYWSLLIPWACNYNCSYCIQGFGIKGGRRKLPHIELAPVDKFLNINRIEKCIDEPIDCLVIQGGEPLLYHELPYFCENIAVFKKLTIISNLSRNILRYIEINKARKDVTITFLASYHHEFADLDEFLDVAKRLRDEQMLEWVNFVDTDYARSMRQWEKIDSAGVSCKPYRFVGERDGQFYPHKARKACNGKDTRVVDCFTTFVLISPDAKVYNCHAKIYRGREYVCHLDEFPQKFKTGYLRCHEYGLCQPCQIDGMKVRKPKERKLIAT